MPSTWILSKAVIVVIVHDADLMRDEDAGIEADADLPGHGDAAARRHGLHKSRGARLRNGAQVVAVPILRHTDTEVPMVMAGFILSGAILMEWLG